MQQGELNLLALLKAPDYVRGDQLLSFGDNEEEAVKRAIKWAWLNRRVKMTQRLAAEHTGIKPPHFANILNGRKYLPPHKINAFEWIVGNRAVSMTIERFRKIREEDPGLDPARRSAIGSNGSSGSLEKDAKHPEKKKLLKVPYYVDGGRRHGEGHEKDRRRLAVYEAALKAAPAAGLEVGNGGIGFAFLPGDGLIGIDLDGMIDGDGEIRERAVRDHQGLRQLHRVLAVGQGRAHLRRRRERDQQVRTTSASRSSAAAVLHRHRQALQRHAGPRCARSRPCSPGCTR
jgi:hypothetical protein